MKRHGILPLLLALVLMLVPHRADAWSSRASKTYYKVKYAEGMVEEYRQISGKLPDLHTCWDSLRKDYQSAFPGDSDPFLDHWKQQLVYKTPGSHGEFDVYSIGADGINNQGEKDDISEARLPVWSSPQAWHSAAFASSIRGSSHLAMDHCLW